MNAGKIPPFPDEAAAGTDCNQSPLKQDHIVSMDKITRMEGFDKLTRAQQEAVLNNPENFVGLSKTANTSKGSKSYAEWTRFALSAKSFPTINNHLKRSHKSSMAFPKPE